MDSLASLHRRTVDVVDVHIGFAKSFRHLAEHSRLVHQSKY